MSIGNLNKCVQKPTFVGSEVPKISPKVVLGPLYRGSGGQVGPKRKKGSPKVGKRTSSTSSAGTLFAKMVEFEAIFGRTF